MYNTCIISFLYFRKRLISFHRLLLCYYLYSPAGSDYAAVNETLLFSADRETTQCFNVSIIDDSSYQGSEVFLLVIRPLDNLFVVPSNRTLLVEIMDDERKSSFDKLFVLLRFTLLLIDPRISFNQPVYTTSEAEGQLEVCVTIDLEVEVNVSAVISSQDNTTSGKL